MHLYPWIKLDRNGFEGMAILKFRKMKQLNLMAMECCANGGIIP